MNASPPRKSWQLTWSTYAGMVSRTWKLARSSVRSSLTMQKQTTIKRKCRRNSNVPNPTYARRTAQVAASDPKLKGLVNNVGEPQLHITGIDQARPWAIGTLAHHAPVLLV